MRQSENQQDSDCKCGTEQNNSKRQIFKIDFSHIFSFPLTCGSKIASDAIIRIFKIKKIQKVPNPVDSSTEPLLFLRNRHQRRTKYRVASVKIPGEMIEHNSSEVSQINLPFSKFDRSSWLRHT